MENPNALKYGQIVYLKTSIRTQSDKTIDYYISGDGFIIKYLFLSDFTQDNDDFSNCLF